MNIKIYDIESLANYFLVIFRDYQTEEIHKFIIDDEINQAHELIEFVKSITYCIGFNITGFDDVVIDYIIKYYKDDHVKDLDAKELYKFTQSVINAQKDDDKPVYYNVNLPYYSVDLFKFWSKKLVKTNKLGLKTFQANMGLSIVEMPISHEQYFLTQEEKELIIKYCLHDCYSTHQLAIRLKDEMNLRFSIAKEYNNPKILSFDAPKIGKTLLLESYCKQTWDKFSNNEKADFGYKFGAFKSYVNKRRYEKTSFLIGDFLPEIRYKTSFFQDLYKRVSNTYNSFSSEETIKNPDGSYLRIKLASGGQHSENEYQVFKATDKIKLVDLDYGSLYPNLIVNYGFVNRELGTDFLTLYSDIKAQRMEAKKNKDKNKSEALKLVLNSVSGLLDMEHSFLYAPEQAAAMRMTGQLILCKLLEQLISEGISVFMTNTDGLTCKMPIDKESALKQIIEENQKEFNLEIDRYNYKAMYLKSISDYFSIEEETGKVKEKGFFVTERKIDKSPKFQIIPKAIQAYFIHGINPEKFIKKHDNLLDFTACMRTDKKYSIFYNGAQIQKLNRFYPSTKGGAYIYKSEFGSDMTHLFSESGVTIVNDLPDQMPTNINYNWFLGKINEDISQFNYNQFSLFNF